MAVPILIRKVQIIEALDDGQSEILGASLNNLALLVQDKCSLAAAEPLFRRALGIVERAFGSSHDSTRTVRDNLAELLKSCKKK